MNMHRQNIPTRRGGLAWITTALIALSCFAGPALSDRGTYKVKVGDHDIRVDAKHARQGNVYIAKTDTVEGDLVSRGGSITVNGVVQGDCAALGGTVAVNGSVEGDLAAFGGGVSVAENGAVGGSIAAFGGSIDLLGKAGDDLACFGGSIALGPKSEVDGDVASLGGAIDKKPGAKVAGEVKTLSFGMFDQFIPGAIQIAEPWSKPPGPAHRALGFVTALIVVAAIGFLLFLVALFFPKHIERMSESIQRDFWTSAGAGMLIEMAIFPALLLMIISILGIPLVPIAVLLLLAAVLMAYAAFGLVVFRKLAHAVDPARYATIAAIMLGYLLLNALYLAASLIRIVPHMGFLAGLFTAINILVSWFGLTVGLGAVWRTRFGARSEILPVPPAAPTPPAPTEIESGRSGIA
ncbi:MAG: polymer-forming cytoskeletal protein [Candidatus Edwardsbacteria bacterium]|nr:polymer-forming cytoskeletal protein [Candidatus Edwardsbacteria bacterium]